MEIVNKLYALVKHVFTATLDLSIETVVLIRSMNSAFKEQFLSNQTNRLVEASITIGESRFKHSMSKSFVRSGFKLTFINDSNLKESEARDLAKYILENDHFVRQLMILGFDTLIIKGKTTNSILFKLSDYASLDGIFLTHP